MLERNTVISGIGQSERQVPNGPEVAVVSNGGGPLASAALLTRN